MEPFGCLAVDFPGIKVGKIHLFSSFFDYLEAFIVNPCVAEYGIRLFLS
jgi:hypothetical protein